ncbi:MAG: DUF3134 domain-containing protein [Gloeocapsa sp. DLM2.Bin57]|nr:MAG: DUF3134 domain-containing protein [Gloeocapsa sp. DLM2.Bin57]
MDNPSLRREPRYEPANVIPLKDDSGLLDWLKQTGRLKYREQIKDIEPELLEQDEEIAELIDVEDYADDFETDAENLEEIED